MYLHSYSYRSYTLTSDVYILNHHINLEEWIEKAPICTSFATHNTPAFPTRTPQNRKSQTNLCTRFPISFLAQFSGGKRISHYVKHFYLYLETSPTKPCIVSAVDHLYTVTLQRHWVIFGTSPEASDVHKRAGDLSILTSKRLWFKKFHVVFFDIFLYAWCSFTFGYW